MDTLDSSTNGQRGYKEGTLDPANERKFKAKKDFKFQGDNVDIWEGKYADFNPSILNFYEMTQKSQSELTGIRPFSTSGSQYESAQSSKMSLGAVAKKETDVSRSFAENFIIPLLRKWLSMINEFMEPEEIERITGKPYVPYDSANPTGSVDIRVEVSTAESDAAKAQDISFMLQTMSQTLPFDLTKILLSEQAELKKMPHLAKRIEEYQPQPDPLEQERKMLEIEELKASIAEKQSRAAENQVDMKMKEAKTVLDQAKARQIHSQADGQDLDFTRKASGQDQDEALQIENRKTRNKIIEENSKPKGNSTN